MVELHTHPPHGGISMAWTCMGIVQVVTVIWFHISTAWFCSEYTVSLILSTTLLLTVFLLIFHNDPWDLGGRVLYIHPMYGWAFNSLLLATLRPVEDLCINYHLLFLWGFKDTLIFAFSNNSLGFILILYPLSIIIELRSVSAPMTYLAK